MNTISLEKTLFGLDIISFILKVSLIYIVWISKGIFDRYFSLKSKIKFGNHKTYKSSNTKTGDEFYKDFYSKIEEEEIHVSEDVYFKGEYRLISKGIKPEDIYASMLRLGLDDLPTKEGEIKKKYRQAAKIHHPDTGGDPNDFSRLQDSYKEVMEANKILKGA